MELLCTEIRSMGDVISYSAKKYGDQIALIINDKTLTYKEIDRYSNKLANSLKKIGVNKGDRVTFYIPNSWQWIVALYSVNKLGAIVNPINVAYTTEEIEYIVNNCHSETIIFPDGKKDIMKTVAEKTNIKNFITIGISTQDNFISFDELIEKGEDKPAGVDIKIDETAFLLYTSGTTGFPKGVMVTHKLLVCSAIRALMHGCSPEGCCINPLTLAHMFSILGVNESILAGQKLVVIENFNEQEILKSVDKYNATMLYGAPAMFLALINYKDANKFDCSSLKICISGGSSLPANQQNDIEEFFNCPLCNEYGVTETAMPVLHSIFSGMNKHGSIGVAAPYYQLKIVDPDDVKRTLAPNEKGELMVNGPTNMTGYWENEAATRETIEPDGWIHTGDAAYMDEEGFVFIVDRIKDMIDCGGYNVYPAEVERVISTYDKVKTVGVGKFPDERKGEKPMACVVLKEGVSATEEEIIAFCREHMAAYKVPRRVIFRDNLPLTPSGKVMRRELGGLLKE